MRRSVDTIRRPADITEGTSQGDSHSQAFDVLRKRTGELKKHLSDKNRKDDLYRRITGEDPHGRMPKDKRLESLVSERVKATTRLTTALKEARIEDADKQMLQRKQQYLTDDSATLEKVAAHASPERRYRAEKNLRANNEALRTLEQQARERVPNTTRTDTPLQQIISERRRIQEKFLTEARTYAAKDLNTQKNFEKLFDTHVERDKENKNVFEVTSSTKEQDLDARSYFIIKVDVEKNAVLGITYQKKPGLDYSSSEVVFNQLQKALKKSGKKPSEFHLKEWRDAQVVNKDIRTIFPHILEKKNEGENEYVTGARTYQRDSPEFEALSLSAIGQPKGFWEAQHQEDLQGKRFASVTVDVQERPPESRPRRQQDNKVPHPLDKYNITLSWQTDA